MLSSKRNQGRCLSHSLDRTFFHSVAGARGSSNEAGKAGMKQ
ncbi:hypothetical protein FTV88_3041 [Heliorestis convoluta]|uniref:Uncharacterized protein n=1 Tax=Heliorestis convoluta TaxID=356322 RepID=A0A5Q2N659_9FIRM|nr:hypothetical protein FTV88_3041 [Heliorestis convoluta]